MLSWSEMNLQIEGRAFPAILEENSILFPANPKTWKQKLTQPMDPEKKVWTLFSLLNM